MSRDAIAEGRIAGPETSALIVAAEWLSGIFIAPMSSQQVAQACARPGQDALRWIGAQLEASAAAEALCRTLEQDDSENLAVHLQRRYTALFEGIFRHRAVLPYESAWQEEDGSTLGGEPVVDMKAVLRALDLHVSTDCCEPPDHLAIELAALAAALRGGQNMIAADLARRLQDWVPAFTKALNRQDLDGFYAGAGKLLLALVREAPASPTANEFAAASVPEFVLEQREGESA
ncbi:TorD/DmsD family molecular chaperone [Halomonas sp. GXIMD04776]|uniref:TorD/DmsD family molecular chaperone n=1 Tax=Halomonas sp. GXIMD04776 TaxID=3415605 RepID=UPI003CA0DEFC